MFLDELNELFREKWSKFLTAGYLVFCKHFPAAGYLDPSLIFFLKKQKNWAWIHGKSGTAHTF